jgi:hypothetical protein
MGREVNILLVEDDKVDVMAVRRALKIRKIRNPLYVASDGVLGTRNVTGCRFTALNR